MILGSCAKSKIKGLWKIERIQSRSDEVNPSSRWVRFDKKTQVNGTGWYQHSFGTWKIKKKEISMLNTNGYENEILPYKLKVKKDVMEWYREEDGKISRIYFRRIEEIPLSNQDKLIGAWKLTTVLDDGKELTREWDPKLNRYIILKWDNTFTDVNTPDGTSKAGMYRVETRRNEVELIHNSAECKREVWKYEISDKKLVLSRMGEGNELILEYKRIDKLPK